MSMPPPVEPSAVPLLTESLQTLLAGEGKFIRLVTENGTVLADSAWRLIDGRIEIDTMYVDQTGTLHAIEFGNENFCERQIVSAVNWTTTNFITGGMVQFSKFSISVPEGDTVEMNTPEEWQPHNYLSDDYCGDDDSWVDDGSWIE
jgi:hypothetical protein